MDISMPNPLSILPQVQGLHLSQPSQHARTTLFAHQDIHQKLEGLASQYGKKDQLSKKIFIRSTTTKPPIVWFPGDSDCGDGGGQDGTLDTFQLIAFMLSAFNIASLMVANVNNNNNNNNINDNDSNANEDNINESNTNANVMSMVMVGLGGRAFNYTKRSIQNEELSQRFLRKISKRSTRSLINHKEELTPVLEEALSLVFRSHLSPSTACLEKMFCLAGQSMAKNGGIAHTLAEVYSMTLAQNIPNLRVRQRIRLVEAGAQGRAGYSCSRFDECEEENWRFIEYAESLPKSTAANFSNTFKLLQWVYNKI